WYGIVAALVISSCGSDEALSPSPAPSTPTSTSTANVPPPAVDPALFDLCGAVWRLVETPGMAERLCALQGNGSSDAAAISQCKRCASSLTFIERLLPDPVCYTALEDCPVGSGELAACFDVIGEVLTEAVPGCERVTFAPLDTTQLA